MASASTAATDSAQTQTGAATNRRSAYQVYNRINTANIQGA